MNPLAYKMRPENISEVIGQEHLLGEGKLLQNMIESGYIPNMIFYGPPGTGKTTVANIIAKCANKKFYKLNATTDSLKDIKSVINELNTFSGYEGVLLYIDEIHHFNKKTQQSLLEFMESGQITLIASTTENPYFYIFKAILSRATILEFKQLEEEDIITGIRRAIKNSKEEFNNKEISYDEDALKAIAELSEGDMRRALTLVELLLYGVRYESENHIAITREKVEELGQKKLLNYDRDGDSHYDILSAFQKSIRGSDPDAAIIYLAMLVKAGDLISICRRLLVIACEDIGLAHPQAISIVKSCVDAANQLGFPEARIPLAEATIYLATSPKSNSAITAIDEALSDLNNGTVGEIPSYLRDGHYEGAKELGRMQGYKYPHSYKNSYVKQEYMPKNLVGKNYYIYGENKMESISKSYWDTIKGK